MAILRAAAVGAALTLLAALVVLVGRVPVHADTGVYPVASDGDVHLTGHGAGHGHGMSQWGADGAAAAGESAAQILSFYYPGTTQAAAAPTTPVRVLLSGFSGSAAIVVAQPSGVTLTATDEASKASAALKLPAAASPAEWRVVTDSAGLHVQYPTNDAASWTSVPLGGSTTTFAGPIVLSSSASSLQLVDAAGTAHGYRGTLTVSRQSASSVQGVNSLPLDQYLDGVVPSEVPPSWPAAALQAQAVAARTYAAQQMAAAARSGASYDICDSDYCQVYGGMGAEAAATTAAVTATSGQILTYQGAPAFAQYSTSNGGEMAAGGEPYLVAGADPNDNANTDPYFTWSAAIPASQIEADWPGVGTLQGIAITQRDGAGQWGGRVLQLQLQGTGGDVTVTGGAFQGAFGLWSNYFTITDSTGPQACPSDQVTNPGFTDVSSGEYWHVEVWCMDRYGYAQGVTATTYDPHGLVNRVQMALFVSRLAKAAGLPWNTAPYGFTDISGLSAADQDAINGLANAGVVSGKGGGSFDPGGLVDRAEMAKFIANTLDDTKAAQAGSAGGTTYFTDISTQPADLQAAINDLAADGVVHGVTGTQYEPGLDVPRDQMAGFLARATQLEVAAGNVPDAYPSASPTPSPSAS